MAELAPFLERFGLGGALLLIAFYLGRKLLDMVSAGLAEIRRDQAAISTRVAESVEQLARIAGNVEQLARAVEGSRCAYQAKQL